MKRAICLGALAAACGLLPGCVVYLGGKDKGETVTPPPEPRVSSFGGEQREVPEPDALLAEAEATYLLARFHRAAAAGKAEAYFDCLTADAVFCGTDPAERWPRREFEAFARPYFDGEEAWTYEQKETHVVMGPVDHATGLPRVAWFDEVLWNEKYGDCRGSGVAVRDPETDEWRIALYSLSLLVPNERTADVMKAIGHDAPKADDQGAGE